jgi:stearoyl-CoA 9-desaturase NADPH oxidoreductase
MPETGAKPTVPKLQRAALRAVRAFSTPLLPDDYLELINPLWSTRELRGRIERIDHVTAEAATVLIKPGYRWGGHRAGQYVRVGVDIKGVRHWRAYSLTSEPNRRDGCISITPKLVEGGVVSPYLVRHGRPGAILSLGGVEGDFVLPDPLPDKLLFISAGSGITPIISMLRDLRRQDALTDAALLHSARTRDDVIFGGELRYLDRCFPGFRLHEQHTLSMGRLAATHLDELCPDWRERETFASGPGPMLDALIEHWEQNGDPENLHMERFQPKLGLAETGDGGTIRFLGSDTQVEADGSKPILVCGEEAGLELPFGCREGICHTCVGTLRSGRIRDLRNGEVSGQEGQSIRTCINAPEGPIEIEL